jgi:hypothetical protein
MNSSISSFRSANACPKLKKLSCAKQYNKNKISMLDRRVFYYHQLAINGKLLIQDLLFGQRIHNVLGEFLF